MDQPTVTQATQKETEISKLESAIKLLEETHKNLKDIEKKEIVLVIGATGSGKSTTINLLLGKKFQEITVSPSSSAPTEQNSPEVESPFGEEDTSSDSTPKNTGIKAWDVINDEKNGPKIGHRGSETIYSSQYDVKYEDKEFSYCDTAGLLDTRDDSYRQNCRFGIGLSIRLSKGLKGVMIVVSYPELIAGRGDIFFNIANFLAQSFKSTPGMYTTNFYFLVTKLPDTINNTYRNQEIVDLLKILGQSQKNSNSDKSQEIIKVIDMLLANPKNIMAIKGIDFINERSKKIIVDIINKFFGKASLLEKENVILGTGNILEQNYQSMISDFSTKGNSCVKKLTDRKNELENSNKFVSTLFSQLEESQEKYSEAESKIKSLEKRIATINKETPLMIMQLKEKMADLPNKYEENKRRNLMESKSRIDEEFNRITVQITERKNSDLLLVDQGRSAQITNNELEISRNDSTIQTNNQEIRRLNDEISGLNNQISQIRIQSEASINSSNQDFEERIRQKQNELNNWTENTNEAHTRLSQNLQSLDARIQANQNRTNEINRSIQELQTQIERLENDATLRQVGETQHYNEHATHGEVKAGTVNKYTFKIASSDDAPIFSTEYNGHTKEVDNGSRGYFDEKKESKRVSPGEAEITYYTPSHYYGNGEFRIFAKVQYLKTTRDNIISKRADIENYRRNISNLSMELRNHEQRRRTLELEYNSRRGIKINELNAEIRELHIQKERARNRIQQETYTFIHSKEIEKNSRNERLNSLNQQNTPLQTRNNLLRTANTQHANENLTNNQQIEGRYQREITENEEQKNRRISENERQINERFATEIKLEQIQLETRLHDETALMMAQKQSLEDEIKLQEANVNRYCDEIKNHAETIFRSMKLLKTYIKEIEDSIEVYKINQPTFEKLNEFLETLEKSGYILEENIKNFNECFKKFSKDFSTFEVEIYEILRISNKLLLYVNESVTNLELSSYQTVNYGKLLLDSIGENDNAIKKVGDIYITHTEIKHAIENKNNYYTSDFINLLLSPLQNNNVHFKAYPAILINKLIDLHSSLSSQENPFAFVPLNVAFDKNEPKYKNHWAGLIIDKRNHLIFYLDPAIKTDIPPEVNALKEHLDYENPVILNPIDFQQKEKHEGWVRHCGVYVIEIFKVFQKSIQKVSYISGTQLANIDIFQDNISLQTALSEIPCGEAEIVSKIRENHIKECCKILGIKEEPLETQHNLIKASKSSESDLEGYSNTKVLSSAPHATFYSPISNTSIQQVNQNVQNHQQNQSFSQTLT